MEKQRDTSWWINDPLMKHHVGENAYLFVDTTFKEERSEDFIDLEKYGYSHYRYLDLLHGGYHFVRIEEVDEFDASNNVIYLYRRIEPQDVREIKYIFEEICFDWMQPAKTAVDYIKETYVKETQREINLSNNNKSAAVVDIKQYKLKRSGSEC